MAGGVVQINVGAATESEMKEKKARVEDALHATRAAVEEGILPGGGVSLLRCLPTLDALKLKGDEAVGVDIVRRALRAPLRQIATNAGVNAAIVLQKVETAKGNEGYDASADRYCDMVREGVIDPTKVVRTALQNAASISTLLLTTDAIVGKIPEKKKMPPMPPGGGYGGYGDMY
jgi:chaperonin GroEL